MAKDYSYLEGMKFTYRNGTHEIPAIVLYADYHIGITCVEDGDNDNYLICLRGPYGPNPHIFSPKGYAAIWSCIVNQIKCGYFMTTKIEKAIIKNSTHKFTRPGTGKIDSSNCAFGQ